MTYLHIAHTGDDQPVAMVHSERDHFDIAECPVPCQFIICYSCNRNITNLWKLDCWFALDVEALKI